MTSEFSSRDIVSLLPLLVLPILTNLGSEWNVAGNNSLLLFSIFLMAFVALMISLPGQVFPQKYYPLAIGVISFCLLYHVQWLSPYLLGWDDTAEFYVYVGVRSSGYWNPSYSDPFRTTFSGALSVTVLPTMIQSLLAVDDITVFKTLYPIAFALVPVVLYLAFKHMTTAKRAFAASLLFASYTGYFAEVAFIGKQAIAEVIIASLILLTYRTKSGTELARRPFAMIILIIGLIAAHYSSFYVYIAFVFLTTLAIAIFKKRSAITFSLVALSAVLALGWYTFTAGESVLSTLVHFISNVFGTMATEFFNPASRGPVVLKFFGVGIRRSPVNTLNLMVQYAIQFFIIVGVVMLWKRRRSVSLEFLSYATIALLLLVASVALPNFASGLNLTRVYQIALIFVAPACVLGGEEVFRALSRGISILTSRSLHVRLPSGEKYLTLAASVVIIFLLFNTGFMNEIGGAPPSAFALGFNRIRASDDPNLLAYLYSAYTPEQDYTSAIWFSGHIAQNQSVCGDLTSRFQTLLAYSRLPLEQGGAAVPLLNPNTTVACVYVYLRYANVMGGVGDGFQEDVPVWAMSEVGRYVNGSNMIYTNGGSEILARP